MMAAAVVSLCRADPAPDESPFHALPGKTLSLPPNAQRETAPRFDRPELLTLSADTVHFFTKVACSTYDGWLLGTIISVGTNGEVYLKKWAGQGQTATARQEPLSKLKGLNTPYLCFPDINRSSLLILPLGAFTAEDQQYVKNWIALHRPNNPAPPAPFGILMKGNNGLTWPYYLADTSGALKGKTIKQIICHGSKNIVLSTDGTLADWGVMHGELDLYNMISRHPVIGFTFTKQAYINMVPRQVETPALHGKKIKMVDDCNLRYAAVSEDGSLFCWGLNWHYQYISTDTASPGTDAFLEQPALFDEGALKDRKVTAVAVTLNSGVALCDDGTLIGWGYQQPGPAYVSFKPTPYIIPEILDPGPAIKGKTITALSTWGVVCSDGTLALWDYSNPSNDGDSGIIGPRMLKIVSQDGELAGKKFVAMFAARSFLSSPGFLGLCSDGTLVSFTRDHRSTNLTPTILNDSGVLKGKTVVGVSGLLIQCSDGTQAYSKFPDVLDIHTLPFAKMLSGKTILSMDDNCILFKEPSTP